MESASPLPPAQWELGQDGERSRSGHRRGRSPSRGERGSERARAPQASAGPSQPPSGPEAAKAKEKGKGKEGAKEGGADKGTVASHRPEKANKRKGKGTDSEALLLQVAARHSLILRELTATVWQTWIVGADVEVADKVSEAGKSYAQKVKELGKGHQLGGPMPHRWIALVRQMCEEPKLDAGARAQWRRYYKKSLAVLKNPMEVHEHVFHFHVQPTYDKVSLKMFFAVDQTFVITWGVPSSDDASLTSAAGLQDLRSVQLRMLLECSMRAIGAERKYGEAPKSDLDRQIAAHLDRR